MIGLAKVVPTLRAWLYVNGSICKAIVSRDTSNNPIRCGKFTSRELCVDHGLLCVVGQPIDK
jgi:hypothetical protein